MPPSDKSPTILKLTQHAQGKATVDLFGVIGGDVLETDLATLLDLLPPDTDEVTFRIYSPGGYVYAGNLIAAKMRELSERDVRTRARVYMAASMATVLAVLCDEVEMAANGRWMIHNPWTLAQGDAAELEKRAAELRATEAEIADLYAAATGQTVERIVELMNEERVMTAAEALELGFIDSIVAPYPAADVKDAAAAVLKLPELPNLVAALVNEEAPGDDAAPPVPPEGSGTPEGSGGPAPAAGAEEPSASAAVPPSENQLGGAPATDAGTMRTPGAPAEPPQDLQAALARVAELSTENASLAGQLARARAEITRKETVLVDLQRRLRAFSPATAGTDEDLDRLEEAGSGAEYWRHVAELEAEGMERGEALLQAQRRWPAAHAAMLRAANRPAARGAGGLKR